ncbi:hypothetical protein D3C85_1571880 [compost metagenome]
MQIGSTEWNGTILDALETLVVPSMNLGRVYKIRADSGLACSENRRHGIVAQRLTSGDDHYCDPVSVRILEGRTDAAADAVGERNTELFSHS